MKLNTRLARALGLDGNPLRRRVDRVETAVVAGLAAVFVIAGPLLAVLAGQATHRAGLAEQRAQQAWRQVSAVSLRPAPMPAVEQYALSWGDVEIPATWAAPDGGNRTGEILALAGTQAGQPVRIWVNPAGRPTGPPLSAHQLDTRVLTAELLTPAILAVLLLALGSLARWALSRRKLAAWESDWALFEPQWTGSR